MNDLAALNDADAEHLGLLLLSGRLVSHTRDSSAPGDCRWRLPLKFQRNGLGPAPFQMSTPEIQGYRPLQSDPVRKPFVQSPKLTVSSS
jgi:hypothetical protein